MSRRGRGRNNQSNSDTPEQAEYKRILAELVKQPGNDVCADCGQKSPKWASATLGIFLCMDCVGHHRSLGAHISFARSITLDNWKREHIENMKNIGNIKSNAKFEAKVPTNQPRPGPYDRNAKLRWIRMKYDQRRFYSDSPKVKKRKETQQQTPTPTQTPAPVTNTPAPNSTQSLLFEPAPTQTPNPVNTQTQNNQTNMIFDPKPNPQREHEVKKEHIMNMFKQTTTPQFAGQFGGFTQPQNQFTNFTGGNQQQQVVPGGNQNTGSVFGGNQGTNQGSIFGTPNQNQNQGSIFGTPNQNQNQNLFGGNQNQNQNLFGGNQNQNQGGSIFGNQQQTYGNQNQSMYYNQNQQNQGMFNQNQQNQRMFNQNQNRGNQNQNMFGNQGVFGTPTGQNTQPKTSYQGSIFSM